MCSFLSFWQSIWEKAFVQKDRLVWVSFRVVTSGHRHEASSRMVHYGRENVVDGATDHRVARQDGEMKGQWSW